MDNTQLAEITYDEWVGRLTTYVLNENQEASPAPRRPAADVTVLVGKRETPRPRRDPAVKCYKCQEYENYQADCDAVLTEDKDTSAVPVAKPAPAPTITPAELKILRRLLAAEGGAGTAGKRGAKSVAATARMVTFEPHANLLAETSDDSEDTA